MFKEPTVLILGAGASAHCDLPMGPSLNKKIKDGIRDAIGQDPLGGFWNSLSQQPSHTQFLSHPYAFFLLHLSNSSSVTELIGGKLRDVMKNFSKALEEQTNFVIDQFLVENEEFDSIGKLCIAIEIIRSLYVQPNVHQDSAVRKKNWHSKDENWYRHLINHAHGDAQDSNDLADNTKLSIVSFNYDPTIDEFLASKFAKASRFFGADHQKCIEIIHVHGGIKNCEEGNINFATLVMDSVRNLSLVGEDVSQRDSKDVSEARLRAKEVISKAARVYIFGFGFHQFNINILNLSSVLPKENTYCLNFDNNGRVAQALDELKIPDANVWTDKGIHELIDQGIFSRPNKGPQLLIL